MTSPKRGPHTNPQLLAGFFAPTPPSGDSPSGAQTTYWTIRLPSLLPALLIPCALPHFTVLIMSKMGRYMATIMPPTMPPRNTIMMGSIAASMAATAASTSSS